MKKISFLWCLVGLLSLTMNAQIMEFTTANSGVSTTDVKNQNQYNASSQDLGAVNVIFGEKDSPMNYYTQSLSSPNSFITTWTTTLPNESITIPTEGFGYEYDVDWGDGIFQTDFHGDAKHFYDVPGTYWVEVSRDFPRIYFNNGLDRLKIRTIEQWGNQFWTSMNGAFAGCENLVSNAVDKPNLSMVTDMSAMFAYARKFNGDAQMGNWNVSNVTNMEAMFAGASIFNNNINDWNVGNVTNMSKMFFGATIFRQDLGNWDVGNVTNMESMFETAMRFNGNISLWNVGNVTTMKRMFGHANRFNQNVGNWNVSNVTNMDGMFGYGRVFNQDLNNWNVSSVTNMEGMFAGASVFNGNISSWTVSNVTTMRKMFFGATKFKQDLSGWNVSNVTNMEGTFKTAMNFNCDISNWNVSGVTTMREMFFHANRFDQDLGAWHVSNVTDMTRMFTNVTLSTANYDSLLNGWESRPVKINIKFDGGKSKYCAGEDARWRLCANSNWTIIDGLKDCGFPTTGDRLAVGENGSFSGIALYPNPMRSQLNIANGNGQKLESASIYDLAGRLIKTVDLKEMSSEITLDVSDLSQATYMVLINGEDGQISKLMVKE